jgi:hypothetical protein
MYYEENIRAILESNFSQAKDELIDNAVKSILAIKQDRSVQDFVDKCRECGAELESSYIKIPDNATNGDMILKVFPDAKGIKSRDSKFITYTLGGFVFTSVDMDWWNASYERG